MEDIINLIVIGMGILIILPSLHLLLLVLLNELINYLTP